MNAGVSSETKKRRRHDDHQKAKWSTCVEEACERGTASGACSMVGTMQQDLANDEADDLQAQAAMEHEPLASSGAMENPYERGTRGGSASHDDQAVVVKRVASNEATDCAEDEKRRREGEERRARENEAREVGSRSSADWKRSCGKQVWLRSASSDERCCS